jgi:cation diffusion facilitator CzcD-associated flavoprotein CzcO
MGAPTADITVDIAIVGSGFAGLGAAVRLARAGRNDFVVLEKADSVGGTWRDNTYPGCTCDVQSALYSFSFAPNPDWTHRFARQPEIRAYLEGIADRYDLRSRIRFGTRVTSAEWEGKRWVLRIADGSTISARVVVWAPGGLREMSLPDIEGLAEFRGTTFHSAHWDHDHDLHGRRVAVIGTGASAVQFVPEIVKTVGHLTVFQRSGNWFLPRENHRYGPLFRALLRWVPGLQSARRSYLWHYGELLTRMIRDPDRLGRIGARQSARFMRKQLPDPVLRAKLWPDYTFGCKRVLFSSHWLPALQRPNVNVVTEAVTGVTATGVQTADGGHHEVDCIIWGTGFATTQFMFPMAVDGAGGRSLAASWAQGAHAHLGMTVPGFPSLFVMYGPNTNTSGGSIVWYLEQQAAYIRQALEHVRAGGAAAIEVLPEVEALSDRETQAAFAGTAWTRCDSWYRDEHGRIVTNWPLLMADYGERVATLDPAEFRLLSVQGAHEPVA